MSKKKPDNFFGRVSNYGSKSKRRKHIEVPKEKIDEFESGETVYVEKIKR
jgi:hypothetical protein